MSDRMYVPRFNVMPDDEVRAFVAGVGTAQLVTVAGDGAPEATFLPVLWRDDRLVGHVARANRHWRLHRGRVAGSGDRARLRRVHVSPAFYATKREHGRVVPTWNYSTVHLRGAVRGIDDRGGCASWSRELTEHHESGRADPGRSRTRPEVVIGRSRPSSVSRCWSRGSKQRRS